MQQPHLFCPHALWESADKRFLQLCRHCNASGAKGYKSFLGQVVPGARPEVSITTISKFEREQHV